ncbi:MAG: phage minor capsid protein [Acutalibacteraceae bacterium]
MTAREIADIFERIQLRLIASLKRNLARHKAEEKEYGFSWPAWQAEKLQNIERFRQENQAILAEYHPIIDQETENLIQEEYDAGTESAKTEPPDTKHFFGVNERRVGSLIEDVNNNLHTAESASLRMMDDVYRQTIYRAEMAAATGSVTMEQAVDMAVKDFLAAGINCIQYRDGRMVNIATYAEMAIRSASLRSYLRGEADRREALGIDTVLVSQYGACSDTCLPWQGKVYIDDVWGHFDGERRGNMGKSRNGKWYLLLSVAVDSGLFHPNCRHTLSIWIDGISRKPKPADTEKVRETAKLEQKQRRMENCIRRLKRLAEGTLEPEKAKEYRRKVRDAQKELREFISAHGEQLRRDYWREKTHGIPAGANTVAKPAENGILLSDKRMTLSEFQQYTKERLGITDLDIKGLSVEGVTKTMEQIEAVYNDFPQLRGYVSGLGQTVPDLKRVPMSTHPADDLSSVTLNFNPVMYHDLTKLKKRYAREVETGKSVAGTSWEHIGLHEMGHVAEGYLISHRYTELADMELDWERCLTASEIIEAAGSDLYGSGVDLTSIRKRLSEYALESKSETLAEAFCDYYANGHHAQPFSLAIMREIRRWFK